MILLITEMTYCLWREFIAFMTEEKHRTSQTRKKTEKIRIIVKAAEKYLHVSNLSVD